MFDHRGNFAKQFEPYEGGYVYYPSGRSGGKFISADEYEVLRKKNEWMIRNVISWRFSVVVLIVIAILMGVSDVFDFPDSFMDYSIYALVAIIVGFILWLSLAPRRLVRGREDIKPPRERGDGRRLARGMIPLRMVAIVCVVSALILAAHLAEPQNTFAWWAWTVGSGAMLAAYLWIGVGKLRDRTIAQK